MHLVCQYFDSCGLQGGETAGPSLLESVDGCHPRHGRWLDEDGQCNGLNILILRQSLFSSVVSVFHLLIYARDG